MNTRTRGLFILAWATVSVIAPRIARAEGEVDATQCSAAFHANPPAEALWRRNTTHATSIGEIAPTSIGREREIAARAELMRQEVLGEGKFAAHGGDIPPIELIPAEGVKWSYLFHTDGTSGEPTKLEVSGIGSSGVLKGTFLAPVSGHNGRANALSWSTTDTYSVRWDVSNDAAGMQWGGGRSWDLEGPNGRTLATNEKSLGVITSQELSIPLVRDRVVRLLYYRSGRAPQPGQFHDGGGGSPHGYMEGRILEIVWDGT